MQLYKNKIVCFIDILGFGDMVSKEYVNNPERIHAILSKIRTAITDWGQVPVASSIDIQITQFSDSLVFSFLPTQHYFMSLNFFKELAIQLIQEGVVFRGGITYGKIFHDREFVFGPAMNEAYRLENKVAVSPRIIIDRLALDLKDDDEKKIEAYTGQFVFIIDRSEYSYVDYISDVVGYVDQGTYYAQLRKVIEKGLKSSDEGVRKKYEWMKDKYNAVKPRFEGLELL